MSLSTDLLLRCAVWSFGLCAVVTAIHVNSRSTTVTTGEDAILFCQLLDTSEKLTRITWQRRPKESSINEIILTITPDGKKENNGLGDRIEFIGYTEQYIGTIRLKNVTPVDQQIYTCIFNIFPRPFEEEIQLTVQDPPVVSVGPVAIPVVGDSKVILATCTARSRPESKVSWHLGGLNGFVTINTTVSAEPDDYSIVRSDLIGVPFKDLNQQTVQCVVNHTSLKKEIVRDYALDIHYPPWNVYITSTNAQEFLCVADANPKPTQFIWSRVNKSFPGGAEGERLVISLNSDYNGVYMCNASNQYGNGMSTMYLQISTGSCCVCWGLFSPLLLVNVAAVLIWICLSNETCAKRFTRLTGIFRNSHDPVPTHPPTRSGSL